MDDWENFIQYAAASIAFASKHFPDASDLVTHSNQYLLRC